MFIFQKENFFCNRVWKRQNAFFIDATEYLHDNIQLFFRNINNMYIIRNSVMIKRGAFRNVVPVQCVWTKICTHKLFRPSATIKNFKQIIFDFIREINFCPAQKKSQNRSYIAGHKHKERNKSFSTILDRKISTPLFRSEIYHQGSSLTFPSSAIECTSFFFLRKYPFYKHTYKGENVTFYIANKNRYYLITIFFKNLIHFLFLIFLKILNKNTFYYL